MSRSSTSRPDASRGSGGFSLLEVLVAFVILTLVVLALFRLFSGALGNASAAEEYSRALLIAESRLTLAAASERLREGSDSGQEDGGRFDWEVAVSRYDPPLTVAQQGQPDPVLPKRLWSVSSRVSWAGPVKTRRSVDLVTLRLGPAE